MRPDGGDARRRKHGATIRATLSTIGVSASEDELWELDEAYPALLLWVDVAKALAAEGLHDATSPSTE